MKTDRLLLVLEGAGAVLVVTTALGLLQRSPQAIASTLGRIDMGVRAIEQQTTLTTPALDRLDEASRQQDGRRRRSSASPG